MDSKNCISLIFALALKPVTSVCNLVPGDPNNTDLNSNTIWVSGIWNLEPKTILRSRIVSSEYAIIWFWMSWFALALAKVVEQERLIYWRVKKWNSFWKAGSSTREDARRCKVRTLDYQWTYGISNRVYELRISKSKHV